MKSDDFIEGKILMYENIIVDQRMLDIGIYATSKPEIIYDDWTIETMIERAKFMKDQLNNGFFGEEYFENLKKCKLVDVKIEIL